MDTAGPPLPPAIMERLRRDFGAPPDTIERLGGMGQGRVYRARSATSTIIVKRTAAKAEVHFYQRIAPTWAATTRCTPTLFWAVADAGVWWLALEDIPHPLPPQRRLADPDLLAILRQIHRSGHVADHVQYIAYRPTWTAMLTEEALVALAIADRSSLALRLAEYCEEARPLFNPECPLSGDPNLANWGVRDDGSLVLFDWERHCLGAPALDLAITVPGLGSRADFQRVAMVYLADSTGPSSRTVERLARDLALAKLWSVVEFLAKNTGEDQRTAATVHWLRRDFAGWLGELAA